MFSLLFNKCQWLFSNMICADEIYVTKTSPITGSRKYTRRNNRFRWGKTIIIPAKIAVAWLILNVRINWEMNFE